MKEDEITKLNPVDRTNLFSRLFFCWVLPIFRIGYKRGLQFGDLFRCSKEDNSAMLCASLEKNWRLQLKKKKPSFALALIRTFGGEYFLAVLLVMVEELVLRVAQPMLIGIAVSYFSEKGDNWSANATLTVVGVCLCSFILNITHHPLLVYEGRIGMRMRVASVSLMYRKIFRLSKAALSQTGMGNIINLMANDVNRFDEFIVFGSHLVVGPMQTILIMVILWHYIGPSCLTGLAILILSIPFQGFMGRLFAKYRKQTARFSDERIKLMNEIIGGIRVIKMYSWEKSFSDLVNGVRRSEVGRIRITCMLKALNWCIFFAAPRVVLYLCFVTYIQLGGHLRSEIVFLTMAMFNNLRWTMMRCLPQAISLGGEALISCGRIQKFLMLEEQILEEPKSLNPLIESNVDSNVQVRGLKSKWDRKSDEVVLSNISFNIKHGELLVIIGPVGAGKSSLLMALLGELSTTGEMNINGRVAYASQESWTFNGTIKQNILFGKDYDELKYKDILRVTSLDKDLRQLSYRDKTLVGEKGVALSGGQKARISLARTLYNGGDIYLLDDPLSAVDTAVAKHIFNECIMKYLKSKLRILVTHQLQFIQKADHILVLNQGKAIAFGTYKELISSGLDFVSFFKGHDAHEAHEKLQKNLSLTTSLGGDAGVAEAIDEPEVEDETKSVGSVKWSVYWEYLKSGSGLVIATTAFVSMIVSQVLFHASDIYLTIWTNTEDAKYQITNSSSSVNIDSSENNFWHIIIYSCLILGLFLTSIIRTTSFFWMCMRASINLHNSIFYCLLRTKMAFFESNPIGRILNRFSRDLGIIDELLPATGFDLNLMLLNVLGNLIVVGYVNPYLVIPAIVLLLIVVKLRGIYIKTGRDIKRFEGMTRSPVFSHVSNTLLGLVTIKSFGSEEQFCNRFHHHIDIHSGTWYLFLCCSRVLGVATDWVCFIYLAIVSSVLLIFHEDIPSGDIGLALSSAILLLNMFQWGIRQSAEFENQMTSVERIIEYSKLESEGSLTTRINVNLPKQWPASGSIEFKNVHLSYPNSPTPVLRNITFKIEGGEKVGIVGRTGAGKSSLLVCLFRLAEPEGTIVIDGVDIKHIGLSDIRKKISIIPQDPVLFSGTVRRNLDPFNEHSDEKLWIVLQDIQLKEVVADLKGQLNAIIIESGSNFSVGQRQLICLGRAILRQNKILVLDEATANVDHNTDILIQQTIKEKFADCTVLTIAHRLHTIIDCDKVIVLDSGQLAEFNEPAVLLKNKKSIFLSLVLESGSIISDQLIKTAEIAYEFRRSTTMSSKQAH